MLYHANNPHGGDRYSGAIRYDFSANTNPYGTPPGVLKAVEEALPRLWHYPDPCCRELVGAIAAFEGVPEEYVLCGNGAAELIYSYCQARKPKTAVELAPTFSEYALALEGAGCTVRRYTLTKETDFGLDEGFLGYLDEVRPDVVFLCNPNNPTGRVIPQGLLEHILRRCKETGTAVFLDECFLDLSDAGESCKDFLSDYPGLFILKAFTKSFGMAGLRLGYGLSADGALLNKMAGTVQPWNVSLPAQAAGVAALQEQAFLARARATIRQERDWLKAQLEGLGLWVCPSQANYLLFQGPEHLDTALKEQGIAIRNCGNYHGLSSGWYRIAVRLHEENAALIAAMKGICGKR